MPRDENAMVKLEQTDLSNFLQALDLNRDDDKVKVETTEPSKVGKWFRTTFKWCVDALSLGCLRRPKYSVQTDAVSQYPMRGSPPAQDDDSTIYAQAPTQGPHLDDASIDTSNAESTGQNIETAIILHSDNVADAWNHEVSILDQQRQFTQTREPQPTIPPASKDTTFCGYADAAQTNMLYGFMDELNTRSVPRMNAEPKPAILPAPVPDTPKKQGPWSSDEHDRYCAGLERCRYGSWKLIADHVGTRTERQVMSHAQSIRAKRKRADERKERHQAGCASSQTRGFEETVASKNCKDYVIYSVKQSEIDKPLKFAKVYTGGTSDCFNGSFVSCNEQHEAA